MRSRYSAFCEGAIDYLVATHHSGSRSTAERTEIEQSISRTDWVNLLIVSTEKGRENDAEGIVEFAAAFRQKSLNVLLGASQGTSNDISQLHERSRFTRENGKWVYLDGDQLLPYQPKRTAPCWCGSGKKFKQCHG